MTSAETLLPDSPDARAYNRTKRWLETGDLVLSFGFLIVLLVTGWTYTLRDWAMHLGRDHYILQLFFYVFLLSVLSKLLGLTLDFYSFRLEHRFNLSNQNFASWVRDQIKGWVLGLVITTVLAEIVYALIQVDSQRWWLWAWLIFMGLFIFVYQLAPVLLFPLFYKFAPLQNDELKARLTRLGEKAGTKVRGVYEWKLSEKSKKANALIAGLGNTRRIMLADTLLQGYSNDEIEAVLAHELGHQVHSHILKGIVMEALITLGGFWAASEVLDYAILQRHGFGNIEHLTDFANMPLLVLVSSFLSIALMPALNAYSRFTERQADVYCWKTVPSVEPYITAMEKLNKQNLSESHPSRIVEILFHSHPPIAKRIAAAEEWARKHRPGLAT